MKISMIILQSLDGIIATGPQDDLSWGTKEDKHFFRTKTKEIGTMIMGRATFENMPPKAFSKRRSLVFTSGPAKYADYVNDYGEVEFFSGTPEEAVKHLGEQGIEEVALIGGGMINGQFLVAGLVDEIFVTVAPKLFADGVRGFGQGKLDIDLELIEVNKITTNELLLRYRVV